MLEELSPQEIHDMYQNNEIILIDVRTPVEFAFERINGALNAPMATLKIDVFPKDQTRQLVFHCGSGVRSAKVGHLLLENGFPGVTHMKGGLALWKSTGLPTVAVNPITGNLNV